MLDIPKLKLMWTGVASLASAAAPAILLLGGSEGGLSPLVAEDAFALRDAGYHVLQLSYYQSPGQAENLEMVALEIFDRGLE